MTIKNQPIKCPSCGAYLGDQTDFMFYAGPINCLCGCQTGQVITY